MGSKEFETPSSNNLLLEFKLNVIEMRVDTSMIERAAPSERVVEVT